MISGFWQTLVAGMVGGGISELIRIGGAYHANVSPSAKQWIASIIFTVLGAGAVLYGWEDKQAPLKVATLGAAFPLLFTAGVAALTTPKNDSHGDRSVSVKDYLSYRFTAR